VASLADGSFDAVKTEIGNSISQLIERQRVEWFGENADRILR